VSVVSFRTTQDKELDALIDQLRKESFVAVSIDSEGKVSYITNALTDIKAVGLLEVAKAAIIEELRDEDADWRDSE
jgi:hypothetical protein